MSDKYYTVEEEYKERFYKLPKVFFTNPKYIKLSNDAKMAYAILQDRLQLSIKNKWFDEKTGKIFFLYSNAKLAEILNCGKNKPTELKKELISVDLLEKRRLGHTKNDMLFLLKPELTTEDIYKIEKAENDIEPNAGNESRKSGIMNPGNRESKIPEIGRHDSLKQGTNDIDFSDTDNNDTENNLNNVYNLKESNDKKNTKNHSSYAGNSSRSNIDNLSEDQYKKEFSFNRYPKLVKLELEQLHYDDAKLLMDISNKAKSAVFREYEDMKNQFDFTYEYHEVELSKIMNRMIQKAKFDNVSINHLSRYISRSIQNHFRNYAEELLQEIIEQDMLDASASFKL